MGENGEGFSGTCTKDPWTKPEGQDQGWGVGMAGMGVSGGGKWRQLLEQEIKIKK